MNCQIVYEDGVEWVATFSARALGFLNLHFTNWAASEYSLGNRTADRTMEVTKALAALQPLYGKGNIEIVTMDGIRVRGIVRSMKTTQALSTPTVKVERADGEIVKVPFTSIVEIINHNRPTRDA
jgi:hypothetical protein